MPLLNHPTLSARYFYPWPNRFNNPFFVEGKDYRLGCRYLKISNDLPTIIHFHGNGETVADYIGGFENRITGLGANLLLAEYRGYSMSSGEPALAAMLDDVPLIVEASGASPANIVFFGRSLGSLYAAHGASLYLNAAGLIIESGLADPLERILVRVSPSDLDTTMDDLQQAVDLSLNQREKIASFNGRVLILHTRHDDLVSVRHAERLYEWANEPKELLVFNRGDHNSILAVNEEEYFHAVGTFLKNVTH